MSLSTNPIICDISRVPLIDFSPIMSHIFRFFVLWVIFYWLPDNMNFNVLGAGYFCIPINILGLRSGAQLSYLDTVWSFGDLLINLVGQHQHSL